MTQEQQLIGAIIFGIAALFIGLSMYLKRHYSKQTSDLRKLFDKKDIYKQ